MPPVDAQSSVAPPLPSEVTPAGMDLLAAADLQDHLVTAACDLERLQRLLDHAAAALMGHFRGANENMQALLLGPGVEATPDAATLNQAMASLSGAVTALQFQDMATQLIAHTQQRLRSCADRLACDVMGDDEDGAAIRAEPPARPNPVTQDEMDAGSIELF